MSIVVNCITPAFNYIGDYRVYKSKSHVRRDFPLDNIETLALGKLKADWLRGILHEDPLSQPKSVTLLYYHGRYVFWDIFWAGTLQRLILFIHQYLLHTNVIKHIHKLDPCLIFFVCLEMVSKYSSSNYT